MKKSTILEIISMLFAFLFLYTGLSKLFDSAPFEIALLKSPLLRGATPVLKILVPVVELLVAIALFLPRGRKAGLVGSSILMFLFTIYVGYMIHTMPHRLPCSCGGIISLMNWHQHLYFNCAFTLLAIVGIWLQNKVNTQGQDSQSNNRGYSSVVYK